MPYQFVVENPVITIDYEAIIWPQSFIPPHATESKRVRGVRRVKGEQGVGENKVVCVSVCVQEMELYFSGDVIVQIAPKDYRQNNSSLLNSRALSKVTKKR